MLLIETCFVPVKPAQCSQLLRVVLRKHNKCPYVVNTSVTDTGKRYIYSQG